MKLTADLVYMSPQFTNTLKDREIDMRGNKIGAIENLGATLDQFDAIDFSDNDIRKLDGFPLLKRLKTLYLSNNRIIRISHGLEEAIPNLEELILSNNLLAELGDLDALSNLRKLTRLSLLRNPVASLRHYRLYVINRLPGLRTLDFQKVKPAEREEAAALFAGAEGEKLNNELAKSSEAATDKPAVAVVNADIVKQTEAIKQAILNATSLEEVARLEAQLKAGILPGGASS